MVAVISVNFWFDPNTLELQGFTILEGQYQAISANDRGYLWSEQLGLYLGIFEENLPSQLLIAFEMRSPCTSKELFIIYSD